MPALYCVGARLVNINTFVWSKVMGRKPRLPIINYALCIMNYFFHYF